MRKPVTKAMKQQSWPDTQDDWKRVKLPRIPAFETTDPDFYYFIYPLFAMKFLEREGLLADIGWTFRGDLMDTMRFANLAMRIAAPAAPYIHPEPHLPRMLFIGRAAPLEKGALRAYLDGFDDDPSLRFGACRLTRARGLARRILVLPVDCSEMSGRGSAFVGGLLHLIVLDEQTLTPLACLTGLAEPGANLREIRAGLEKLGLLEGFEEVTIVTSRSKAAEKRLLRLTETIFRSVADRLGFALRGHRLRNHGAARLAVFLGAGLLLRIIHAHQSKAPQIYKSPGHVAGALAEADRRSALTKYRSGHEFFSTIDDFSDISWICGEYRIFEECDPGMVFDLFSLEHVAAVLAADDCRPQVSDAVRTAPPEIPERELVGPDGQLSWPEPPETWPPVRVPGRPAYARMPEGRSRKVVFTALVTKIAERHGLFADAGRAMGGDLTDTMHLVNLAMRIAATIPPKIHPDSMVEDVLYFGAAVQLENAGLVDYLGKFRSDRYDGLLARFSSLRLERVRALSRRLVAFAVDGAGPGDASYLFGSHVRLLVLDRDSLSPVAILPLPDDDPSEEAMRGALRACGYPEDCPHVTFVTEGSADGGAAVRRETAEVIRLAAAKLWSLTGNSRIIPNSVSTLVIFLAAGILLSFRRMIYQSDLNDSVKNDPATLASKIKRFENWGSITRKWSEGDLIYENFIPYVGDWLPADTVDDPMLFERETADGLVHLLSLKHLAEMIAAQ
ncbi:hypothetical protein [Sutterella sp.]|uniref:hypothetical protein n=1 Tax=Sutterella sp. TaxID=1981025 RepID=UPI0026DEA8BD|nr:hypothetical protein [Sutterella sp.]MDO5532901.1 hypothetical protein [Sutterella sp.]